MTDVAQLDIVIRAINAAGPGIRSAQRDIASLEGASTKTGASMEQTTKSVGRNWERIGLGMTNVGRALTNYVGIPTLAVGAATSVLAYKYNKAMTRIGALTGASQKQTEQWRQQVLALAKTIGRAPQDLAEGLYFVASSGFKGARAFGILKAAATAAAAGLGNTLDVADAITSVMSAYGPKVISAAKATNVLVAAVREGKAEPQEFSESLGRIIPVAAKAHVSFGQVAGVLSAMTVTGLSTYEAVTALRAGINAIQAPTKQGMTALKEYGLSYVKLRDDMKHKGLIQTFEEMDKAFKGDPLAWRKAIGNIRAVTGVQSLLSARYEKNIALVKRVQGASGDLAKAMDRVKQSSSWKWDKALSDAKVAAIDFGSEALPVFTSLLGVLTRIMNLVNRLPSGLKKAALVGGLAVGAGGLLLQGIGGSIRGAQLLGGVLGMGSGAASAAAGSAGTAAAAGSGAASSILEGAGGAAAGGGLLAGGLVAALAAAVATALAVAIPKAMAQYSASRNEGESKGRSIWDSLKAGIKAPGDWLYKVMGGDQADMRNRIIGNAESALRARHLGSGISGTPGSFMAQQKYLREDLDKLWAKPVILGKIDSAKTKADMIAVRNSIMSELRITKNEANTLTGLLFKGWNPAAQIDPGVKRVQDLRQLIATLRTEAKRSFTFGDLAGADRLKRQAEQLQRQINRILNPRGTVKVAIPGLPDWTKQGKGGAFGTIPIKVNVAESQAKVASLKQQIKSLSSVKGDPKLDARDAALRAKLTAAQSDLTSLNRVTARPTIEATNHASSVISTVKSQLESIPHFIQVSIHAVGRLLGMAAHASGAVVRSPEIALIGEKGPEAVVPLNDISRQTAVLREAGILARGGSAAVTQEIHYHNHQYFPQGVVVSDIERFGRQVEPYTTRGMDIADRRRQRGLAGMA
jgi:TP901 family phage tail tape measure protein